MPVFLPWHRRERFASVVRECASAGGARGNFCRGHAITRRASLRTGVYEERRREKKLQGPSRFGLHRFTILKASDVTCNRLFSFSLFPSLLLPLEPDFPACVKLKIYGVSRKIAGAVSSTRSRLSQLGMLSVTARGVAAQRSPRGYRIYTGAQLCARRGLRRE